MKSDSEVWKELKDYSNYEISSFGNLRNKNTKKHLKLSSKGGYFGTCIKNNNSERKSMKIHRLVALTFIPNPENKYTVNHKDHNKSNNNINNLEWATITEQNQHKRKTKKEVQRLISSRKVWRINKDTNEKIELYETMRDASKWVYNNNLTTVKEFNNGNNIKTKICAVCRKRKEYGTHDLSKNKEYERKTAFGFKWEYDHSDNDIYDVEEWKDIPPELVNGTPNYKISNYARVKNNKGRITEGSKIHHSGYIWVSVYPKQYLLHRLVALVFIPNINKKEQVNHIDGNKQNNKVSNLEWCTNQENSQHAYDIGLHIEVKPIIQYDINMNKIKEFKSRTDASKELNIPLSSISRCCIGRNLTSNGFIFKFSENTDNNKPHKCEKCNIGFKFKSQLEKHCKTELHKTGKKKTRSDKKEEFKCEICNLYTANQQTNLKLHILNNHKTKEERKNEFPYYCELCDSGFMEEKLYKKHLETKKHKKKLDLLSK